MTERPQPRRPRDADRTRADLLAAARELFGQQGYTRTTLREIGDRAGVDAALVARYFGNKASLYVATFEGTEATADAHQVVQHTIARTHLGPTPLLQAIVQITEDALVDDAARRIVRERVVEPLRVEFEAQGRPDAALRAEVASAMLTGVVLGRSAGLLDALAQAPPQQVIAIVLESLGLEETTPPSR